MNRNGDTQIIEDLHTLIRKEAQDLRIILADLNTSPQKREWILERLANMEAQDLEIVEQTTRKLKKEK